MYSVVVAECGGLICGLVCGVTAAAIARLPSGLDASLVIAACTFGMMASTPVAGYLADAVGRKRSMIFGAFLLVVSGVFVCGTGGSVPLVMAGRFLQGACTGFLFLVVPMYLWETIPPARSGRGIALFQLLVLVGQTAGAGLGMLLTGLLGETAWVWMAIFAIPILPTSLFIVGLLFARESDAGRRSCGRKLGLRALGEVFRAENRRAFLSVVLISVMVAATANGPVMNLSVKLMQDIGMHGLGSNAVDLLMQASCLCSTVVGGLLVDYAGMRRLMVTGALGLVVGLGGLAIAFSSGLVPLAAVSLLAVSAMYCIGPGICVFLMKAALLPERVRAVGGGAASFLSHAVSASVAAVFLPAVSSFGHVAVFLTLALFAVALACGSFVLLPRCREP